MTATPWLKHVQVVQVTRALGLTSEFAAAIRPYRPIVLAHLGRSPNLKVLIGLDSPQ